MELNVDNMSKEELLLILQANERKVKEAQEVTKKVQEEKDKLTKELQEKDKQTQTILDVGGQTVDTVKDVKTIAELASFDSTMAGYLEYLLKNGQAELFLNMILVRVKPILERSKQSIDNEQIDPDGEVLVTQMTELRDDFFDKYGKDDSLIDDEFPKSLKEAGVKFHSLTNKFEKWQNYVVELSNMSEVVLHSTLLARKALVPSTKLVVESTDVEKSKEIEELKEMNDKLAKKYNELEAKIEQISKATQIAEAEKAKEEDLATVQEATEEVGEEETIREVPSIPEETSEEEPEEEHKGRGRGRRQK